MALIFQAKRRLLLTPSRGERFRQRGSPTVDGPEASCPSCSAGFGKSGAAEPICAGTLSLSGSEEAGGKLNSAGNLRSSSSLLI